MNIDESVVEDEPDKRVIVAPTMDGLGIVVPPDLYRPYRLMDGTELEYDHQQRIFVHLRDIPLDLVQEARQALKEGYPGTALQLGRDLWWIAGDKQLEYANELLCAAYEALNRPLLAQITREHFTNYNNRTSVGIMDSFC